MFSTIARGATWLKMAWITQPIIFVSCALGFAGPLFVYLSPLTKNAVKSMKSIPEHYPYPQLEESQNDSENGEPIYPFS